MGGPAFAEATARQAGQEREEGESIRVCIAYAVKREVGDQGIRKSGSGDQEIRGTGEKAEDGGRGN